MDSCISILVNDSRLRTSVTGPLGPSSCARATVRFRWHRFGPINAAEIPKSRVRGMKSSPWRWHLDEMFVKINCG